MSNLGRSFKVKQPISNYATLLKHIDNVNIESEVFSDYLSEQFSSISNRDEIISFLTFYHWIQLPMPFAEKFFSVFVNSTSIQYISRNQFINGLTILYLGSIELQLELLFKVFDSNADNKIWKEDMKILFIHLLVFTKQLEKERGLSIIDCFFEGNQSMTFQSFAIKSIKINSDCFYLFILLLALNKPFCIESLKYFTLITKKSVEQNHMLNNLSKYYKLIEPTEEYYSYISDVLHIDFAINFELNDLEDFEYSIIECKSLIANPANANTLHSILNTSENSISTNESHLESDADNEINLPFLAKFTEQSLNQSKRCKLIIIGKDAYVLKKESSSQYLYKKIIPLKQVYCEQGSISEEIINNGLSKTTLYPLHIISTVSHLYKDFLLYFKTISLLTTVKDVIESKTNYRKIEDEYMIEQEIDHGSYGQIFKAKHKISNEVYAIKVMNKLNNREQSNSIDCIRNEQYISMFIKEIPHKGIISIHDIYESKGKVYIIQEYIPNGNLYNYIHTHCKKTQEIVLSLFFQLIESILHFQKYGIVHRDLKPENIMLKCSKECTVINAKLIDFGISKIILKEQQLKDLNGTFSYLPPEMFENNPYSHNIDVWGVGLIGYIMLYGYNPFKDETIEKMIKKRVNVKLAFPKFTETKYTMIRNIVITCLETNPVKRPQIETLHQQMMKVLVL